MATARAGNASLAPLRKTLDALKDIRACLLPFLRRLDEDAAAAARRPPRRRARSPGPAGQPTSPAPKRGRPDDGDPDGTGAAARCRRAEAAEAAAAAALAVGTLRYMGARLRGRDRGRKKGDPLRAELDRIRGLLVALRKLEEGDGERRSGKAGAPSSEKGNVRPAAATAATGASEGHDATERIQEKASKRQRR